MKSILVAGIGNIFHRDDGFGVAVAQALAMRDLAPGVRVMDAGIRGIDLAFALVDGYDATILIDTVRRGEAPGTLYVIEPDLSGMPEEPGLVLESHKLDPVSVLRSAVQMGANLKQVILLGCEPAEVEVNESGVIGLTGPVQAAVVPAVDLVVSLLRTVLAENLRKEEEEVLQ